MFNVSSIVLFSICNGRKPVFLILTWNRTKQNISSVLLNSVVPVTRGGALIIGSTTVKNTLLVSE